MSGWNGPLLIFYETGGMRRVRLRGHTNILKRLLIHTGGFNRTADAHTLWEHAEKPPRARGDDVRDTIVDGKVLMRDRMMTTLNEAAILKDARGWAEKVRAAVK